MLNEAAASTLGIEPFLKFGIPFCAVQHHLIKSSEYHCSSLSKLFLHFSISDDNELPQGVPDASIISLTWVVGLPLSITRWHHQAWFDTKSDGRGCHH